jgi:hypothetical protein
MWSSRAGVLIYELVGLGFTKRRKNRMTCCFRWRERKNKYGRLTALNSHLPMYFSRAGHHKIDSGSYFFLLMMSSKNTGVISHRSWSSHPVVGRFEECEPKKMSAHKNRRWVFHSSRRSRLLVLPSAFDFSSSFH